MKYYAVGAEINLGASVIHGIDSKDDKKCGFSIFSKVHPVIHEIKVTSEMVKENSIVIDVGMNRKSDGSLCGDVDFESASRNAGWITPVPGGVGPMTIALLLQNTVLAAKRRARLR